MKTIINIKGTHCQSCKMLIEDICSEFQEIKSSALDFKTGRLVIEHDEKLDLSKLKKEIKKLGDYSIEE